MTWLFFKNQYKIFHYKINTTMNNNTVPSLQNENIRSEKYLQNHLNKILVEFEAWLVSFKANFPRLKIEIIDIENNLLDNLENLDTYFWSLFTLILWEEKDYDFFLSDKKYEYYFCLYEMYCKVIFWVDLSKGKHKNNMYEYGYKYFLSLYEKYSANNWFKYKADQINITNVKIQEFLLLQWITLDISILKKENILEIIRVLENNTFFDSEITFIKNIITYLSFILITNSFLDAWKVMTTIDDMTDNENIEKLNWLYLYSVSLIAYSNKINNDTISYKDLDERRKLKNILWEYITIEEIIRFEKSYLYFNYFKDKEFHNYEVLKIFIKNYDLFLNIKTIPCKKIFDLLLSINDQEIIEKISNFFNERKHIKIKEDVLLEIIENLIKTNFILNKENSELIFKYIHLWIHIWDIFKIWINQLIELNNYPGDKKNLIKELLINPEYLINLEKIKIINELKIDIKYLHPDEESKILLEYIISHYSDYNLDTLVINILTIKIKSQLDEKIHFAKKILRNSKEKLTEKLLLLDILKNNFSTFKHSEDILFLIFSYPITKIHFIVKILPFIDFWENISVANFSTLIELLITKETYIKNLSIEKKLTIDELNALLDSKTLKEDLVLKLKNTYNTEQFDILYTELKLHSSHLDIEKISLIIDIWNKLDEIFKEDFILHLESLSIKHLKFLSELIPLFKFYKINIWSFNEYLKISDNIDNLQILKNIITNNFLKNILNISDFKKEIILFLNKWNLNKLNEYILLWNKKDIIHISDNEYDQKLIDIYLNGTMEEKEIFVKKITIFLTNIISRLHPSLTTSTKNFSFWPGSGSYSEIILNYILKRLMKITTESIDIYLERLLLLNGKELFNIENISDIKWSHELKCLYKTLDGNNENKALFKFLFDIEKIMWDISWESYVNLTALQKYYNSVLKEELKKIKRSLDI